MSLYYFCLIDINTKSVIFKCDYSKYFGYCLYFQYMIRTGILLININEYFPNISELGITIDNVIKR